MSPPEARRLPVLAGTLGGLCRYGWPDGENVALELERPDDANGGMKPVVIPAMPRM